MNIAAVLGTHSSFFYYGSEHLYFNMLNYVKEGLGNNELIYIYMFPEMYKNFIDILSLNEIDISDLVYKCFKELILMNSNKGFHELNITLD